MKLTFQQFMKRMEALCMKDYGCTTADLPDWSFFDAWDSGMSVSEAFDEFSSDIDSFY